MSFQVELLPAFADNYIFLVSDKELGLAMVVDPGDANVTLRALKQRDLHLSLILVTHHHSDHIGGCAELQKQYGAPIIGPTLEKSRVAGLSRGVGQGDVVSFSTLHGQVIDVSGHTSGHIAYYFPQIKALFAGDALFSLGCGKLFEGTAAAMWDSLMRLRALPDDTLVYAAHEYTEANAQFALAVDKDNAALKTRAEEVAAMRKKIQPTIPTLLGVEKKTNPFLRVDQPDLQKALAQKGLAAQDSAPAAIFGALRAAKDRFGGANG